MKNIPLLLIVSFIFLLAGCTQTYVCEDGRTVPDPDDCIKVTAEKDIQEQPAGPEGDIGIAEEKGEEPAPVPQKKEYVFGEFEGDYYNVGLEVKDKGILLRFLGYYYIKKGDDFGKITGIKYKIINDGISPITPSLKLSMINSEGDRELRITDVEREEIEIEAGQEVIEEAEVDMSFNKLDIKKILELDIYDAWTKGSHMFTVRADADFS